MHPDILYEGASVQPPCPNIGPVHHLDSILIILTIVIGLGVILTGLAWSTRCNPQ